VGFIVYIQFSIWEYYFAYRNLATIQFLPHVPVCRFIERCVTASGKVYNLALTKIWKGLGACKAGQIYSARLFFVQNPAAVRQLVFNW
jgi:hypothetical protein